MSHAVLRRGFASAALLAIGSMSAHATAIFDLTVSNQSEVIGGLVPLDLSSVVGSIGGANNNVWSQNFTSSVPGAYTGTLTATVYGNVGAPGASLTDIAIIYEFVGNGPSAIDQFQFGIDGGASLDFDDTLRGTHGTVLELTTPGQLSPLVVLANGGGSNNTLTFDFAAAGDPLGTGGTQSLGWYVSNDAAVQINLVDVVITDFGNATAQTLAFTDIPGQPDIGVPAPGAIALFGMGLAAASRRRR